MPNMEEIQKRIGAARKRQITDAQFAQYQKDNPDSMKWPVMPKLVKSATKGRLRNQPCPCESGKKYKKCCLPGVEKHLQQDMRQQNEPDTSDERADAESNQQPRKGTTLSTEG